MKQNQDQDKYAYAENMLKKPRIYRLVQDFGKIELEYETKPNFNIKLTVARYTDQGDKEVSINLRKEEEAIALSEALEKVNILRINSEAL